MLKKMADNTNRNSWAGRFRARRHGFFLGLLSDLKRPITILDVGGTENYWQLLGVSFTEGCSITLLNLEEAFSSKRDIKHIVGDARKMEFDDKSFDVVFSNSVIEHVGGFGDQMRMAEEVRRVGMRFFVQTPNKYFPLEPHFLFPLFQFLPISTRMRLLMHFNLGWFAKTPDARKAREIVESVRLLKKAEVLRLFPGARLFQERILGLTKSFIAYDGWGG